MPRWRDTAPSKSSAHRKNRWHLKLPDIETADSDFSLTPYEMRRKIKQVRELTGQN
jgi:hypothetical protein